MVGYVEISIVQWNVVMYRGACIPLHGFEVSGSAQCVGFGKSAQVSGERGECQHQILDTTNL